jgi:hypothetical protein
MRKLRQNLWTFDSEDEMVRFVSIVTGYPEETVRCMRRQVMETQEAIARWEGEGGA